MKSEEFTIRFDSNWYKKNDILELNGIQKLLIIQDPHRVWWKRLLQIITFNLYKAPWEYKVEVI